MTKQWADRQHRPPAHRSSVPGSHAPAVQRRAASSLLVGRADDPAEADADRFADGLMRDLQLRPMMAQRSAATPAGADELGGSSVDTATASRIRRATGGVALPERLRAAAEQSSGRDLSGVRVHAGADAAELSASLQAEAFTVGSNVFLGADAARPGSTAGDALLAHEVGHVIQQGGVVASRSIRRRPDLVPLSPRSTTLRRKFGKKRDPLASVKKTAEASYKKSNSGKEEVVTDKELDKQIAVLESALRKLLKRHEPGDAASQAAAGALRDAAERMARNLPRLGTPPAKLLGPRLPEQLRRLNVVIGETGIICDEQRVAATNRRAQQRYMEAGRSAGTTESGALTQLSGGAKTLAFADLPKDDPNGQKSGQLRVAGLAMGLSPAEIAAIMTFTSKDYRYINPAVANSESWMKSMNTPGDHVDKEAMSGTEAAEFQQALNKRGITATARKQERADELTAKRQEGGLHAGMAMQGLLKLPVWKGTLYRGEVLTQAQFDERYTTSAKRFDNAPDIPRSQLEFPKETKFVPTPEAMVLTRSTIASASKSENVARSFWYENQMRLKPNPWVRLIWVMEVTNGRDIESISTNSGEQEVATLPGAEFVITEMKQIGAHEMDSSMHVRITCRQIR